MDASQLELWFEHLRDALETSYIQHAEPWCQSGMSGPEARWISLRKPVADCIDRSGAFLDIGCANGYFLQCALAWTAERGIDIQPYGLDLSSRLVELAKQRLPQYAANFFVGNGFTWQPPVRFDFVRTELVYVPAEHEREYVLRIFDHLLVPGGRLIVPNYAEGRADPESTVMPGCHATSDLLAHLAELRLQPLSYRDGYDPIKGRKIRVAVLSRESVLD